LRTSRYWRLDGNENKKTISRLLFKKNKSTKLFSLHEQLLTSRKKRCVSILTEYKKRQNFYDKSISFFTETAEATQIVIAMKLVVS